MSRDPMSSEGGEPRARCYRCLRPQLMCLCADAVPVATRTGLFILQHPRERLHPFGTARIARLLLPKATIAVPCSGWDGNLCCELPVPADTAVLYPHRDAADLATLPVGERPSALVVLDGTWAHAKKLYRDNPWLARLRHVRLQPASPSNYRIRKEPQADYVSTIEAIVGALRILEPENTQLGALLGMFDRMIDRQIEHLDVVVRHGRARRPRQRASRRLSPVLAADDLVVIYAESWLPGGDPTVPRAIVQWVAARASGGPVFEVFVRGDGPQPRSEHLQHMGLRENDLASAVPLAEAEARFVAFAGTAPLAAWTRTTLDWGSGFSRGRATTALKTDYCNLRNHRSSYLETVVAREGLESIEVAVAGRARQRLGNALAVARWLAAERRALADGQAVPRTS